MTTPLTAEQLEALRRLDTCALANAIERFNVRLRNEGYTNASIRCLLPRPQAMVGYAVTLTMRSSSPPTASASYLERTDWWDRVLAVPAPRVIVIQDTDEQRGAGSLLGEVHANVFLALGCVGVVTNGAVRDLPAIEPTGFHLFAANLAVSHGYAHIVQFDGEVEVGGLKVRTGDLLHGDIHGVLSLPKNIAADLPAAAEKIAAHERKIVAACRAPDLSLEQLRAMLKELNP